MGKISEGIAIAIGAQVAEGTPLDDVKDATALTFDKSLVGTAGQALGFLFTDDSLSWDFDRNEEARPDFVGTFSKQGGDPTTIDVPISFDFPWKGGGNPDGNGDPQPSTPAAGEFNLSDPVTELLIGAGISEGAPGPISTLYTPGPIVQPLTVKIWRKSADTGSPDALSWTFQDCKVQLEWTFTPGEASSCSATLLVGAIVDPTTSPVAEDFPTTVNFGTQLTLPNPVLRGAQAQIGSIVRGFLDGTITLDAGFEDAPDSNSLKGTISEQAERTFTFSGGFYVDDTDPDQDYANLIAEGPSTDDLAFFTGDTIAASGGIVPSITRFVLFNLNYTSVSYRREAGRVIWDLEFYATTQGAGDDEVTISGV